MNSAAVVVGVDRTGGLTPLKAAASGAKEVAEWLRRDGYEVTCLVDERDSAGAATPVTRKMIFDAVTAYVNRSNLEKLVIYFAGHGYLRSPSEIWLLSGAPDDPNEAVDQTTSADMARSSNIKNVVFISDSCRSIPASLLGQKVNGGTIFPNRAAGSVPTQVDHFFATRPGDAAIESQVPEWAEASGLFTHVLKTSHLDPPRDKVLALGGRSAVPSRWLQTVLPDRVDEEAQRKSLALSQRPDVRLETEQAFLAFAQFTPAERHDIPPPPASLNRGTVSFTVPRFDQSPPPRRNPRQWRDTPQKRASTPAALHDFTYLLSKGASEADLQALAQSASAVSRSGPPANLVPDTGVPAWISVEGAGIKRTAMRLDVNTAGQVSAENITYVSVPLSARACSAAIEFSDGSGTVVAALRDYLCRIKVSEDGVKEISYVPFAGERADIYRDLHAPIEETRAIANAAAAKGLLDIDRQNAKRFAETTRRYKMFDPALGMVAALAYAAAGLREHASSVRDYTRNDLGIDLFDIWLLAGAGSSAKPLYPFCPMMTQSWSYLDARGVKIHPLLRSRGRHSGFWTTFSKGEMRKIIDLLEAGELK